MIEQSAQHHPSLPRRPRQSLALPGLAAMLLCGVCTADVRVELSSDTIQQHETVQLQIKADGANLQPPDLSVLDPDFSIVDRRVQRSRSVINGRSRERVRLTLMLLPKRAGTLEIPAISLGSESTRPLTLTVTASAAQTPAAPETGETAPPQPAAPWSDTYLPPWQPYGPPPPLYANPNAFAPNLLDPSLAPESPEPTDLTNTEVNAAPLPATTPESRPETLQDPWFWTTLILAVALLASLFRRNRAQAPPTVEPPIPAPPPPERPPFESPAIAAIRVAYETGNAAAAREALLAWGRQTYPQHPPTNLARLALRCDEPARKQIQLLEQSSYSPTPIEWNGERVWEWLEGGHPRTEN